MEMDAHGRSHRAGAVPVPALCRSRAARRHADGENLRVRQEDSTVLDGESFSLNVAFEDGSGIDAVGTNSFPDGYYEKKGAIQAFFEALMREYEIDADKIGYW